LHLVGCTLETSMFVTHLLFYIQQLVMEHLSPAYTGITNVTKLLYTFQLVVAFVTVYCEPFSMLWTPCVCYFNNVHLPCHCLKHTKICFQLTTQHTVLMLFTCFSHKPQPSSGSYQYFKSHATVIQPVSHK